MTDTMLNYEIARTLADVSRTNAVYNNGAARVGPQQPFPKMRIEVRDYDAIVAHLDQTLDRLEQANREIRDLTQRAEQLKERNAALWFEIKRMGGTVPFIA